MKKLSAVWSHLGQLPGDKAWTREKFQGSRAGCRSGCPKRPSLPGAWLPHLLQLTLGKVEVSIDPCTARMVMVPSLRCRTCHQTFVS